MSRREEQGESGSGGRPLTEEEKVEIKGGVMTLSELQTLATVTGVPNMEEKELRMRMRAWAQGRITGAQARAPAGKANSRTAEKCECADGVDSQEQEGADSAKGIGETGAKGKATVETNGSKAAGGEPPGMLLRKGQERAACVLIRRDVPAPEATTKETFQKMIQEWNEVLEDASQLPTAGTKKAHFERLAEVRAKVQELLPPEEDEVVEVDAGAGSGEGPDEDHAGAEDALPGNERRAERAVNEEAPVDDVHKRFGTVTQQVTYAGQVFVQRYVTDGSELAAETKQRLSGGLAATALHGGLVLDGKVIRALKERAGPAGAERIRSEMEEGLTEATTEEAMEGTTMADMLKLLADSGAAKITLLQGAKAKANPFGEKSLVVVAGKGPSGRWEVFRTGKLGAKGGTGMMFVQPLFSKFDKAKCQVTKDGMAKWASQWSECVKVHDGVTFAPQHGIVICRRRAHLRPTELEAGAHASADGGAIAGAEDSLMAATGSKRKASATTVAAAKRQRKEKSTVEDDEPESDAESEEESEGEPRPPPNKRKADSGASKKPMAAKKAGGKPQKAGKKGFPRRQPKNSGACFNCGEHGHPWRLCRKPRRWSGPNEASHKSNGAPQQSRGELAEVMETVKGLLSMQKAQAERESMRGQLMAELALKRP